MMSAAISSTAGAPRVGADLRAARERLGLELAACSAALRIRLPYLHAIEDGRIGDLPGNAYAVGFLRTYATALGLDPDEVTRRFRAEAAEVNRKTELDFPAPVPERGMPAGAVVLLGVVLAVGAYVGWYRLSGEGRLPAEVATPVPERLAPLAEQAIPPSVAPPPAATPAPVVVQATPAPPADTPVIAAVPPSAAAAAIPPPAAATAPPTTPVVPPAPAPLAGNPDDSHIVLRARGDAWMQVRDKQGQVLLNRVLRAGETWPVPGKQALLLTTGNAGGTELLVDGVVAPSIGTPGAVRRDLPLDAELIRDGKLPAQVAAQQPTPPVRPPAPPQAQ